MMTTTGTGSFHLIMNSTEFYNLFASPLLSVTRIGNKSSGLQKNNKVLFKELYKADNSKSKVVAPRVSCLPAKTPESAHN